MIFVCPLSLSSGCGSDGETEPDLYTAISSDIFLLEVIDSVPFADCNTSVLELNLLTSLIPVVVTVRVFDADTIL